MQPDPATLVHARAAAAAIAPMLGELDRERRLPPAAVDALVGAGVCKLCVPRTLGGGEASPATLAAVIEELARSDGSLGWIAMIVATSGLMSVYLDDATARELYAPADAITCGVFAPSGRAVPVDGGYRVSGRWAFASGCELARWRMGGVIVAGEPPEPRWAILAAADTSVHDTWDTTGLRATGSHDFSATDVFVPRARTFSLFADQPRHPGYALPFFGVLASGVAAVGLGIARGALDAACALVQGKPAPGGKKPHAQRELVQVEIARGEARVRAARAALYAALADACNDVTLASRAHLRIAACHAATESAQVTAAMYELGGGAAVYRGHALERRFRDASVVTHHLMVSSTALAQAGRVLLGVETDTTTL